ncbi:substrate-binding periplasmic protein [Dasania marina]|uniref:substrate-binding periplasmic protein n=1 Tax=Dasania marina TaxID=471499 RepID=UPI00035C7D44|nr:transporter substrate-binding domain-containing protein [Dasania marina]
MALKLLVSRVALSFIISTMAYAEEVRIAMGNFEPYYIESKNGGVFADIISAAFLHIPNYHPKYIYGHSNEDLWASFDSGHVDAASNFFGTVIKKGCLTNPVFRFSDMAVTKASSALAINHLDDLKAKSIVAYQGAKELLGDDFGLVVTAAYQEVAKPELQVRMLVAGRYQVSVGDKFIFLQAVKNLNTKEIQPQDFKLHDLFPPTYTRLAFHEKSLCEKFNLALERIKQSGQYEAIYQSYLSDLNYP